MDILIRPILESLIDDEDCLDENDEDAIAFGQGVDSSTVEVQPGETFEIPEGHQGVQDGEIILEGDTEYVTVLWSGMCRLPEDGTPLRRVR